LFNGQDDIVVDFNCMNNSGSTWSYETDRSIDRIYGTPDGTYLYIEANDITNKDDKALLISEHFDGGLHCLIFCYHLYEIDIGILMVYSRFEISNYNLNWDKRKRSFHFHFHNRRKKKLFCFLMFSISGDHDD
jgi:hypothetical protein